MPEHVNGSLAPGQHVYLNTPSNPYLHGAEGTVKELTSYGAVVSTKVAATGQFRALREEMTYQPPIGLCDDYPTEAYKGNDTVITSGPPLIEHKQNTPAAKDQGFTGDVCMNCGGCRMVRNGSCTLCQDCGNSSGCS